MAITAVAALASAGSVAAGIVAIETIATIAAVVSVVGAVTDNKALKKIGMGMGLAAMGASIVSSTTGGATVAGEAASEAASGAAATESGLAAQEASNAIAAQTSENLMAGTAELAAAPVNIADASSVLNAPASLAAEPSGIIGAAQEATSSIPSLITPEATSIANQAPTANSAFNAGSNVGAGVGDVGNVTAPSSPFDSAAGATKGDSFFGDAWDKTSSWLDKNKSVANTLLQVGGQALSGAARGEAEQKAYDLQNQQIQFGQKQILNQSAIPVLRNNFNRNYARQGQGIIFNAQKG